jgi:hypothetical protein
MIESSFVYGINYSVSKYHRVILTLDDQYENPELPMDANGII